MRGLLAAAKRKLRIDEADTADDLRVEEILESAKADLAEALAVPKGFDFMAPGMERDLLLARVFYEWNDALDEFEANYASMLSTTREKWIARRYAQSKEEASQL